MSMMIQQNQLHAEQDDHDRLSLSALSHPGPGHVVVHLQDDPYYQDGNRNNAKIVALVDFIIAVLVIIILIAFITTSLTSMEENTDSDLSDPDHNDSNISKGDQLISISINASFLVLLCCGIWIAILLLKSTKPTISRHKATKLAKYWLFYNTFLVILTAISITLLLLYKNFLLGFGGIGFLIIRLIFIGIVFRFWKELKSGGGAVTTTEASAREFTPKLASNLN